MSKITRYVGDTYPESFTLSRNDEPVDLSTLSTIELHYSKDGTNVSIAGVKDSDDTTGRFTAVFTDNDVDTAGQFDYCIRTVATTGEKTTFVKSVITFLPIC